MLGTIKIETNMVVGGINVISIATGKVDEKHQKEYNQITEKLDMLKNEIKSVNSLFEMSISNPL